MIQQVRIGIAARVFCVAAVLGLSLALLDPAALQGTLTLAAIAAMALAVDMSSRLPDRWVLTAEAAMSSLVVGMALPQGILLLPYLVVPALIAGITLGVWPVITTVCVEVVALAAVVFVSGQLSEVKTLTEITGPWLATTLGIGLIGARLRSLRSIGLSETDAAYEAARRLLFQLKNVARRLSSGLDTGTISSQLLLSVHAQLGDTRSAAFVRTEGGILAPLSYRGPHAREELRPEGDMLDACWADMEPVHGLLATETSNSRHQIVLPLRVGPRMIGVVLLHSDGAPQSRALVRMMREVDEFTLRIATALAFDELRSIATLEERHRLAREIHDGIAQEIASLGYLVDDIAATTASDSRQRKLQALRGDLTRIVSELRLSIFDLRSELSAGLGSALSDYVREVGSRSGLTVHLTLDVATTRLRGEVEAELLRISQEAITNARKHSGAANLWVDCRIHPPYARIRIRDDGRGLGKGRGDSFGLEIMKERSQRIGADLAIGSGEDGVQPPGTVVTVTLGTEQHPLVEQDTQGARRDHFAALGDPG